MKKHQFEELTAALSVIIALLAYKFEITWLFYIYLIKAIGDSFFAILHAYYYVNRHKEPRSTEYIPGIGD